MHAAGAIRWNYQATYVAGTTDYTDGKWMFCPSFAPSHMLEGGHGGPNSMVQCYGRTSFQIMNDKNIPSPASYDVYADTADWNDGVKCRQWYVWARKEGDTKLRIHVRHNGRANYCFADGHVAVGGYSSSEASR